MLRMQLWIAAALAALTVIAEMLGLAPSAVAAQSRPNVVMVVTDDQRLDEMQYMPLTCALIGGHGTTFQNFFASYPLCAPSRATMLSGQYMHNHNVRTLSPPDGGFDAFDFSTGLAVWLQRAGYRTAHVGKPMNGYGLRYNTTPDQLNVAPTPPGYDDWFASLDPTTYEMYGTVFQDNGVLQPPSLQYQTDQIADRAVRDIRRWAPGDKPFFMQVNTSAPHSPFHDGDGGPQASPRYEGSSAGMPFRPDPSFDEDDVSDKPSIVRGWKRISAQERSVIAQRERDRIESLQSVDELVGRLIATLSATGELDNTVFMYLSDNGWFNGEHRWFSEKIDAYDPSIHVPLLVRGPGFPAGVTRTQPTANIDLTPTIVELTQATPGRVMDGESLVPYAADPKHRSDRAIGIEAAWPQSAGIVALVRPRYNGVNVYYDGVRTRRYKYVEYTKDVHGMPATERQLYDLDKDPNELSSRHDDPAYAAVEQRLQQTLQRLRKCQGSECRQRFSVSRKAKRKRRARPRRHR